jgi:trk system potassium uptake protein TrkA
MYIVIAGGGVLGGGIARGLVDAHHDVVVVDQDRGVCERLTTGVGVLAVHGVATNLNILRDAGMEKADVAVGALNSDADNLSFCLLSKSFGVSRVIARIRDPQYANAYSLAGVERALNASSLFAERFVLEIEDRTVRVVASLGQAGASILMLTIPEGAGVSGKSVQEIASDERFPEDCLLVGVFRQHPEAFVFPRGTAVIRTGDKVFLAAHAANARKALRFLTQK